MSWKWHQEISKEIFEKKYMLHGEKNIEEVFDLISQEISNNEEEQNEFYNLLMSGKFIPAGRILANARPNSKIKNYSNCFVIDIEDDMNSITKAIQDYMLILKNGGGVGFNISKLRPKGTTLSTGGTSSGPLSFMEIFNTVSSTIQVGGARRGATLIAMDVNHPDIEDFILAKQGDKNKRFQQMNISVAITDDFMKAVKEDKDWDLTFNGKVYKTVKAQYLYNLMIKNAFENAEPGILFKDTINKNYVLNYHHEINATNPCGEEPIPAFQLNGEYYYGSCNLGAINLTKFVEREFESSAMLMLESDFEKSVASAVKFLDNVLDKMSPILPEIEREMKSSRRIGLGITGFGDALAMLGIEYGSEKSKVLIEHIMSKLYKYAHDASEKLGKERGSFPFFDKEKYNNTKFIKEKINIGLIKSVETMRNATLLTIAPTGTTSLSVGNNCSSGIEPIFALEYDRKIRTDREDSIIEKVCDYAWLKFNEKEEPKENCFITSHDINPKDKIDIISIAQKYIDAAISNTTNLKKDFTYEEYKDLFAYAHMKGLKGFTSFWEGGNLKGILNTSIKEEENKEERPKNILRVHAPKRPEKLICDIQEISVNKEKHIVLIGKLNGMLYEIFVTNDPKNHFEKIGKKEGIIKKNGRGQYSLIIPNGEEKIVFDNIGKEFDATYGSLSRFISMGLRHGVPLQFIVDQLNKDKNFVGFEKTVARVLKKYIEEGEKVLTEKCPECNGELIYQEGCKTCPQCLWSKCG